MRAIRITVDDHPTRETDGPGQSDASRIEDTDVRDLPISRIVSVAPNDPITIDARQEGRKLSIGRRRVEPGTLIGVRRRMHTQEGLSILKPRDLALRKIIGQAENPSVGEDPSGPGGTGQAQQRRLPLRLRLPSR